MSRNIHSLQDCLILQEDLDSLGLWEADWQMKFNVAKCHSMRVTRHYSHKQIMHDYTLLSASANFGKRSAREISGPCIHRIGPNHRIGPDRARN